MTDTLDLVGLTLLHFLWQGAFIAVITGAALHWLRRDSPQSRYLLLLAALAATLVFPAATTLELSRTPRFSPAHVPLAVPAPASPLSRESARAATTTNSGWSVSSEGLLHITASAWLACVLGLIAQLAGGCWRVRRMARGEPSSWQRVVDDLSERLNLRRRVRVVESAFTRTPFLVGWLRPTIVLPLACLGQLSPLQVETILLHELAHVRRHDFLVNVLQTLVETLFFYHPAVWWISRKLREERELCCDDTVVNVCGSPEVYASALIELAAGELNPTDAIALAAARGPLSFRIQHLLRGREDAGRKRGRLVAVLVLFLVAAAATPTLVPSTRAAQSGPGLEQSGRFGPREFNRLIGFELFPGPINALGDPSGTVAWPVVISYPGGEMTLHGFTARALVRMAYGMPDARVAAPAWVDRESFAVTLAADHLPASEELPGLMRRYFEERLELRQHLDRTDVPVYALSAIQRGTGSGLRSSASECNADQPLQTAALPPRTLVVRARCGFDHNLTTIAFRGVSMTALASQLSREPFMDRVVVDRTGLGGAFDGELRMGFMPAAVLTGRHQTIRAILEPVGFDSIFKALPDQLGLTLEPATASRDLLIVDTIQQPH